jgi:hypothetical protein
MGPSNDYSCTAWFQSSLYSFSEKNINLYFVNEGTIMQVQFQIS